MVQRTPSTAQRAEPATRDGDPLLLQVWLSPAFPIGAFAYSHGIEWVVEAGDIGDRGSLEGWIADLLEHGGPWSDAVLLACAHRAVRANDVTALRDAAELALALAPSRERRLETSQQGTSFLLAVRTAWPCEALQSFAPALGDRVALPIAVGVTAAGHDIGLPATLDAFLLSIVTNLVSSAVRLVPLGQTDGTLAVAHLVPALRVVAARAAAASLDDAGGCALRSDVASMRHETQTTRLFRS
jgi:urease accessory protein